jgi:hypothetical protein
MWCTNSSALPLYSSGSLSDVTVGEATSSEAATCLSPRTDAALLKALDA